MRLCIGAFDVGRSALDVRWVPVDYSSVAIRPFFIRLRASYGKDGLD